MPSSSSPSSRHDQPGLLHGLAIVIPRTLGFAAQQRDPSGPEAVPA